MNIQKRTKQAWWFITITYILTIIFHIGLQLAGGSSNDAAVSLLGIPMVFPFLSMMVMMVFNNQSFPKLNTIQFRLNGWHAVAIVVPLVIVAIENGAGALFFSGAGTFGGTTKDVLLAIFVGLTVAALSAWFEEVAWRGYLHRQLEAFSAIKRYVLVGLVWSLWHLPTAIWYKYDTEHVGTAVLFLLQLFILSILISYIRERSRSVVAAALMHGMMNAVLFTDQFIWFAPSSVTQLEWVRLVSCVLAVAGMLVISGEKSKAALH